MYKKGAFLTLLLVTLFLGFVDVYAEFEMAEDSPIDLKLDIKKFTYIPELKIGTEITEKARNDNGDVFETLYYIDIDEKNLGLMCIKLESESKHFKVRMYYKNFEEIKKSMKIFKTDLNQGYLGERLIQQVSLGRYYIRVTETKNPKSQQTPSNFTLTTELDHYEPNGYKEHLFDWVELSEWECMIKSSLINSKSDVDWYKIKIRNIRYGDNEKITLKIYISSPTSRDEDNLVFRVLSEKGDTLALWNDYSGWLEVAVPEGEYYVRVARSDMTFSRAIFRKYDIYFSLGYCVETNKSSYANVITSLPVQNQTIPHIEKQKETLSNAPNPFNPETDIAYEVPEHGTVVLNVFNTKGKKVIELVNGFKESGSHSVHWNGKDSHGKDMPSGVYYAVLEVNGKRFTKKMIMLK